MNAPDFIELTRDRNGHRVLRVGFKGARGFRIETNGNLPRTHRDGVGPWTLPEVRAWVASYGTPRQREMVR